MPLILFLISCLTMHISLYAMERSLYRSDKKLQQYGHRALPEQYPELTLSDLSFQLIDAISKESVDDIKRLIDIRPHGYSATIIQILNGEVRQLGRGAEALIIKTIFCKLSLIDLFLSAGLRFNGSNFYVDELTPFRVQRAYLFLLNRERMDKMDSNVIDWLVNSALARENNEEL